jgi:S-adenosylmethionine decarboxylase proenzyme
MRKVGKNGFTKPLGTHIALEVYTKNNKLINDEERLKRIMRTACRRGKVHIINEVSNKFTPHGVSIVFVLSESHLSIHTWPEYGYVAVDIFTCGGNPEKIMDSMIKGLKSKRYDIMIKMDRGLF